MDEVAAARAAAKAEHKRLCAQGDELKIETPTGLISGTLVDRSDKGTDTDNTPGSRGDIAIMIHGLGSHRNMRFFPMLADTLPASSYRFDIQGHGKSTGEFSLSYKRDVETLEYIITHLEGMGFSVTDLIGHSKGANIVLSMHQSPLPSLRHLFICSSRHDMLGRPKGRYSDAQRKTLAETGCFRHTFSKYTGEVTVRGCDMKEREQIDMDRDHLAKWGEREARRAQEGYTPLKATVVHGRADTVIPYVDAERIRDGLERVGVACALFPLGPPKADGVEGEREGEIETPQIGEVEGEREEEEEEKPCDHMFAGYEKAVADIVMGVINAR
ncbi:hypothetical protein KIPB_000876 [Kipferlia bialata]|uniref:AB hydrolase-1 domain-containing protein n=1 Tax=Kipferlia bialata TaxID=797122 RepID=A0A9K3GDS6_9EUKA|nr:hypothetical protein KIPB_000876 [Kipferlia bialata]|eukprot:g876.t1